MYISHGWNVWDWWGILTWVISRKGVPVCSANSVRKLIPIKAHPHEISGHWEQDKILPAFPGGNNIQESTQRRRDQERLPGCWRANLEMGDNGAIATSFSGKLIQARPRHTQPSHKSKGRRDTQCVEAIYLVPLLQEATVNSASLRQGLPKGGGAGCREMERGHRDHDRMEIPGT